MVFAKHLDFFLWHAYPESQWWNEMLVKWLDLGAEDKKVAKQILIPFHCKVAATSNSSTKDDSNKRICKVNCMNQIYIFCF